MIQTPGAEIQTIVILSHDDLVTRKSIRDHLARGFKAVLMIQTRGAQIQTIVILSHDDLVSRGHVTSSSCRWLDLTLNHCIQTSKLQLTAIFESR